MDMNQCIELVVLTSQHTEQASTGHGIGEESVLEETFSQHLDSDQS